jgi:hypothetical protein
MTSFAIFAPDNGAYYYEYAQDELFCPSCKSYIEDASYHPKELAIKKLKTDFSFTYDGQLLLNNKAVEVLREAAATELIFFTVNQKPEIFILESTRTIVFDSNKRMTRFVDPCSQCGNFASIVGSTPVFLSGADDLGLLHLATTDLKFGSGKETSPLYIVGEDLGRKLKLVFREIELEEVKEG